jgi:hypothetical protein
MDEHATTIPVLPNPTIWELVINFITRLIKSISGPDRQITDSPPRQRDIDKAHKMIRMAQNEYDDYEDVVRRIRQENARYKTFKKNCEPIGRFTLNVKQFDSDETGLKQYEVKDPAEGKASVFYTHPISPDIVLEFMVHDENDEPVFAIARTYSNWVGCKEFDLGGDRAFYLHMVEDEKAGHVAVQAGFKTKEAAVPVLTFPNTTPDTPRTPVNSTGSRFFKKLALVGVTNLAVLVFCCLLFNVTPSSNAAVQNGPDRATAENTAKPVNATQITRIIWTNLSVDSDLISFASGGETEPRKIGTASKSKHAAGISAFAVSVDAASLDESVRCGQELLNRIRDGIGGEAKKVNSTQPLKGNNCGNTVKFVVSFEPVEQKSGNFLFTLGGDNHKSIFDNDYELGDQEFTGNADELANLIFRIIAGQPDTNLGADDKRNEVAMTE